MKIMILCGGQGTRLREHTELRPKPMVEIGGRPILWHIMKLYSHYGFDDFILCLGYKSQVVKEFFLNYRAMTRDFTLRLGEPNDIQWHDDQAAGRALARHPGRHRRRDDDRRQDLPGCQIPRSA